MTPTPESEHSRQYYLNCPICGEQNKLLMDVSTAGSGDRLGSFTCSRCAQYVSVADKRDDDVSALNAASRPMTISVILTDSEGC